MLLIPKYHFTNAFALLVYTVALIALQLTLPSLLCPPFNMCLFSRFDFKYRIPISLVTTARYTASGLFLNRNLFGVFTRVLAPQ